MPDGTTREELGVPGPPACPRHRRPAPNTAEYCGTGPGADGRGVTDAVEQDVGAGAVRHRAHGRPDQTWPLARIKTLIGRRFHKGCTAQGVTVPLKRHGWSCQVPARRRSSGTRTRWPAA
ncbi:MULTISPECIES: winged helix-turn-helix domain-containing protein [Streptomyces]|nr:winged helix-turn-helix domain-containing protein [Streptomyces sp. MBT70]